MYQQEVYDWQAEQLSRTTAANLIKNGFEATYVATKEEAKKLIMSFIQTDMEVGFGGSMTVKELGIQDKCREIGAKVYDHSEAKTPEEKQFVQYKEQVCDVFLSGCNAVSMDGVIYNIDAVGNRVAAMLFGPKKVLLVVGANKICLNKDAAYEYMRRYACPLNNKRLGRDNPCVQAGYCVDCRVEGRICRAYVELRRRPLAVDTTVIIVGQPMGL
ncbi:MAG: lactate utilization protein [Christensenellales bacterium]|jgi:L-lactate utilization protein LutB